MRRQLNNIVLLLSLLVLESCNIKSQEIKSQQKGDYEFYYKGKPFIYDGIAYYIYKASVVYYPFTERSYPQYTSRYAIKLVGSGIVPEGKYKSDRVFMEIEVELYSKDREFSFGEFYYLKNPEKELAANGGYGFNFFNYKNSFQVKGKDKTNYLTSFKGGKIKFLKLNKNQEYKIRLDITFSPNDFKAKGGMLPKKISTNKDTLSGSYIGSFSYEESWIY